MQRFSGKWKVLQWKNIFTGLIFCVFVLVLRITLWEVWGKTFVPILDQNSPWSSYQIRPTCSLEMLDKTFRWGLPLSSVFPSPLSFFSQESQDMAAMFVVFNWRLLFAPLHANSTHNCHVLAFLGMFVNHQLLTRCCYLWQVNVHYLDHGQQENIPIRCILDIPPDIKQIPHQVCTLYNYYHILLGVILVFTRYAVFLGGWVDGWNDCMYGWKDG